MSLFKELMKSYMSGNKEIKCSWCGKLTDEWYAVPVFETLYFLCSDCYNKYADGKFKR